MEPRDRHLRPKNIASEVFEILKSNPPREPVITGRTRARELLGIPQSSREARGTGDHSKDPPGDLQERCTDVELYDSGCPSVCEAKVQNEVALVCQEARVGVGHLGVKRRRIDQGRLGPPECLFATIQDGGVLLEWQEPQVAWGGGKATSYIVEKCGRHRKHWTQITVTEDTSFVFHGLIPDKASVFRVIAVNRDTSSEPTETRHDILIPGSSTTLTEEESETSTQTFVPNAYTTANLGLYQVHFFVQRGLLKEVAAQIEENPHMVDALGICQERPLHCAARCGHVDIVRYLIKKGAQIDVKDERGWTPLHHASVCGKHKASIIMGDLLKAGASATSEGRSEVSLLAEVAKYGDIPCLKVLLEHGARFDASDPNDALFKAAEFRHKNVILTLLQRIPLSHREEIRVGELPMIHYAAKHGYLEFVECLLAECSLTLCKDKDDDLFTCLHHAVNAGHYDIAATLLDHNTELARSKDLKGMTCLHHAVRTRSEDMVKLLADSLPKLIAIGDIDGNTALHSAVRDELCIIIELLCERGADPRLQNRRGDTSISLCSGNCQLLSSLICRAPAKSAYKINAQPSLQRWVYRAECISQPPPDIYSYGNHSLSGIDHIMDKIRGIKLNKGLLSKVDHRSQDCYPISSAHAIILNNNKFSKHSERVGSQVDVKRLTELFKKLGFNVDTWQDRSKEETLTLLSDATTRVGHSDAFILVIMSHGSAGQILTPDNKWLDIANDVCSTFNSKNFPAFQGKPKVFLFQACREYQENVGDDESNCISDLRPSLLPCPSRTGPDTLLIFSTHPGFRSRRNSLNGSWFIEELVLMMELFANELDLQEMIIMANRILECRHSNPDVIQQAQTYSTLMKRIYLPMGLPHIEMCSSPSRNNERYLESGHLHKLLRPTSEKRNKKIDISIRRNIFPQQCDIQRQFDYLLNLTRSLKAIDNGIERLSNRPDERKEMVQAVDKCRLLGLIPDNQKISSQPSLSETDIQGYDDDDNADADADANGDDDNDNDDDLV